MVSFEDFKKLSIKVARIKDVIDHPNADKLYIVKVDIGGEEKEIVAGVKNFYTKDELKDKLVVVIDNLEPAVIRGVESKGMLLATQDGVKMAIISPDKDMITGSIVK